MSTGWQVLGLAWLGMLGSLLFLRRRGLLALWREPILRQPVVILESDDWGVGPESDATVLGSITTLLRDLRDATGHPAVMTLGVVAGAPDGAAILGGGCAHYHRTTLLEARYAPIVAAMREGCAQQVFALQRHGLEHCWPASLLARARQDEALRRWLMEAPARSEDLPPALQSRWVDASELPTSPLPQAAVSEAVNEEARILERLFGVAAPVAVPNTFVWDDAVERAWAASGVTCIVTPGCRYEGRDADGRLLPATRVLRNGQRDADGICFVVRDVYFEPRRGHRAEDLWRAVAARSELGRPTLVETHRDNFIADRGESEQALAEFARALQGVTGRHADVRFMSTENLVRHFRDPQSPLLVHGRWQRLPYFLARLRIAPELRGVPRWFGLGIVVAGLASLFRPASKLAGSPRIA